MKTLRMIAIGLVALMSSVAMAQEGDGPKPIAGYEGGFFIQNPEGEFKLKINARVQPQYYFQKGTFGAATVNTFRMRRASLVISGQLSKSWSFSSFLLNVTGNTQAVTPLQWGASIVYAPNDLFNLEMGMVGPPFDRFGLTGSGNRMFVEPSIVVTEAYGIGDLSPSRPEFGLTSAPGFVISGVALKDKLQYGVGVTNGPNPNGQPDYLLNYNKRLSAGARVQYNVLKDPGGSESDFGWSESPALALGVGGGYEDQGAADAYVATVFNRYNLQGTGDVTFKYKGLSVIGSWYGRMQYNYTVGTNSQFNYHDAGYYALVGYFVIPKKLEVGARASQQFREGPNNNANAYEGTVNWYIKGNNVKWQTSGGPVLDYDALDGTNGRRRWRIWSMLTMSI